MTIDAGRASEGLSGPSRLSRRTFLKTASMAAAAVAVGPPSLGVENTPAMSRSLLGDGSLRLRGNCHCHSSYSDGAYSPEETVARYRDAGYDFLFLTEHCDKLTYGQFPDFEALDSPSLRVLPGVEYRGVVARYGRQMQAMITGLNTLDLSFWKPAMDQQAIIDGIRADGGLALLSCTYWDGRTVGEMANLQGVTGIEIYNATCEGAVGKGNAVMHWDELLESGMHLWGLAVDDCHFAGWPDFGLGWIVACVQESSAAAITSAIRAGHFYSSCGPEIRDFQFQGGRATLRCSPVNTVVCNSVASAGYVVRAPAGESLTEWVLDLPREWITDLPYFRLSCCDAEGRWAWTNPVWMSDIFAGPDKEGQG